MSSKLDRILDLFADIVADREHYALVLDLLCFDSKLIVLLNAYCQAAYLVLFVVYCIFRWMRTFAARQQTSWIRSR
jgi:hypothetical protein